MIISSNPPEANWFCPASIRFSGSIIALSASNRRQSEVSGVNQALLLVFSDTILRLRRLGLRLSDAFTPNRLQNNVANAESEPQAQKRRPNSTA